MKIDRAEVEKIARLARLDLASSDIEVFRTQLSDILTYVEKLDELDTANAEPTSHVLDLMNVGRLDAIVPPLPADKALANAPDRAGSFFRVPKIIE
jgi:aspartyl-tRNA(Asn)/glutamyl-tRNA(Gln) amidotransferase subunit C